MILLSFLLYWVILFVFCFIVTEYAQGYLYDEVTPMAGLKVGGGTLIFALMMTYFHPSYDTMFTVDLAWTALQAIVWFVVFALVFQFHGPHALGLGLVTFVLSAGLATLALDSLSGGGPAAPRRAITRSAKPIRKAAPVAPRAIPDLPKAATPLGP